MCGIFGIYSNQQNLLEVQHNSANLQLLSHRGPDDSGSYRDDRVYLGHVRLSILDVISGNQPMISDDGRFVIVYNGEIYNYLELRDELLSKNHYFKTTSDTEVILKLYQNFGPDHTLSKLEGMFAFSIWDQVEHTLFIARDRIGEKPLYYAYADRAFLFASEIKAITNTGLVTDELHANGLYEYFCRSKISGSRTFYQNIFELNPGHYLLLSGVNDRLPQYCYWDLVNEYRIGQDRKIVKESEAHSIVEKCVHNSVRNRMISDVPVGLLTSGGIDSSIVTAMLAASGYKGLQCFCAGNRSSKLDESPFAKLLVSYLNQHNDADFNLNIVMHDVKSLVDEIPFLSKIYDEPLQHLSSVQMYKLCSAARDHDIKVLISGEGSDEIFCGYDRYDRIFTFVDEMTNGDYTLEDILYYGGGLDNAEIVSNICGFEMTTIDDDLRGESYRWLREHKDIPLMDLVMLYDQRHRLQTILQRQDRMGMAASIELRQPFLNYRLVNAVNSIDSGFKFEESTRETKYILKRVSEKFIPQDIISRKKVGFSSDLTLWFRSRSSRDQLNELVRDSSSITRNYLDLKLIESVIEDHYNASKHYDFLVKSLYYLEVWNRHR